MEVSRTELRLHDCVIKDLLNRLQWWGLSNPRMAVCTLERQVVIPRSWMPPQSQIQEAQTVPGKMLVFSAHRKAKKLESAVNRHGSDGCSLRIQRACEHVHAASLRLATILSATHSHED